MDNATLVSELTRVRNALRAYDTQGLWRDDAWRALAAEERRLLALLNRAA